MILSNCLLIAASLFSETKKVPAHITVPPGFIIEQVAGPPLVERPMMAGFDERGRLFVCDSSGHNLMQGTSDDLVKSPPHGIKVIEDTNADGTFDTSSVFADKMTFPMGALWHDGALFVASPPYLWRLEEDPKNSGKAANGRSSFRSSILAVTVAMCMGRFSDRMATCIGPTAFANSPYPARKAVGWRGRQRAYSAFDRTAAASKCSASAGWTTPWKSPSPKRAKLSPPSTC